jgi:HlyD family type I secretion membrane fusion protein
MNTDITGKTQDAVNISEAVNIKITGGALAVREPELETSTTPIIRSTVLILVLVLGSFLAWAAFAPLAGGVMASGMITVFSNRKTVQHRDGGIIEKILVTDGDRVLKDQLLISLNDVQPAANLAIVRNNYLSMAAFEARLLAERKMAGAVTFPPELASQASQLDVARIIFTQKGLFQSRTRMHLSEKEMLNEDIRGTEKYIARMEELQQSEVQQIALLTKQMSNLQTLADQGHYPQNRMIEMERMLAELNGRRSENLGNIARAYSTVNDRKLRLLRIDQEYLRDVDTQLSDVQPKLSTLKDQYTAAIDVAQRTEIRSPVAGVVLGLSIHTVGGVIGAGQHILEIVPDNSELIISANVMTRDIDKVHKGSKAELRFDAFNLKNTPVFNGEVIMVSPDVQVDQRSQMPYYLCHVKISNDSVYTLAKQTMRLQPGMPVTVIFKTEPRTPLNYLLKPLLDRLSISLKEAHELKGSAPSNFVRLGFVRLNLATNLKNKIKPELKGSELKAELKGSDPFNFVHLNLATNLKNKIKPELKGSDPFNFVHLNLATNLKNKIKGV